MTIKIDVPPYLAQWFRNAMGGEDIVRLPKGSPYTHLLRISLRHKNQRPNGFRETGNLEIIIPSSPGRSSDYFNWLPDKAQKAFIQLMRDAFDAELFKELNRFSNIGKRHIEILLAWMEAKGIEETDKNTNSILKRLQIIRSRVYDRDRRKKKTEQ